MDDPIWIFPKDDPAFATLLEREFYLHPVVARILVARGLTSLEEAHRFLYTQPHDLLDPFLFSDMRAAVERISKAIELQEPILIYGDTDVDGMTGTALLVSFLRRLGGVVQFHLPVFRGRPVTGALSDALGVAQSGGYRLVITVDCGITVRNQEIRQLKEHGIDLIITDHHEPTSRVSGCTAILNPKTEGSGYPNTYLTGVGVAFKLAQALLQHWTELGREDVHNISMKEYLDLAALGTVADLGILKGENRIFVRYGLKELHHSKRAGLKALLAHSHGPWLDPDSTDVVARLAPRLNSLGRISEPRRGVEILLTEDMQRAQDLSKELEKNNALRQRIERTMAADLERMIREHPEVLQRKAIALSSDKWHPGVIPILSARLAKQYNRPVCLVAIEEGVGKGSLRTIPDLPLLTVLHGMQELLLTYGGHDSAAGLLAEEAQIPALLERFIEIVEGALPEDAIARKLKLDGQVNLADLSFDLMESLSQLEPYGNGNPPPILMCEARLSGVRVTGKQHLKLFLEDGDRCIEGLGLGMAERRHELSQRGERVRVVFTPAVVIQHARASIHLSIRDIKLIPTEQDSA